MKHLLSNPYLILLTRAFLGFLFVVSSLEKIVDPAAFALSIGAYRLLPGWLPMYIATVVPWLELLCGLTLLFGLFTRGSSLLVSGMLIVFTLGVISGLLRGLDISCGCFTQDPNVGKIGWMKVLQNSTLIVLSLYVYFATADRYTLSSYLRKLPPAPGLMA